MRGLDGNYISNIIIFLLIFLQNLTDYDVATLFVYDRKEVYRFPEIIVVSYSPSRGV